MINGNDEDLVVTFPQVDDSGGGESITFDHSRNINRLVDSG